MPPPRPPSQVDSVAFPVFGMSWFGDPGDGTSIVGYCGGGGSAATGVNNSIIVRAVGGGDRLDISTGKQVGVAIKIFRNPLSGLLWLVVALGDQVWRYTLPGGDKMGELSVGDTLNALAVNAMADNLAVGGDSGVVRVYAISDDEMGQTPLYTCEGHTMAICAVDFSLRGDLLASSAKDGTARVWQKGKPMDCLTCDVTVPKKPPPKRVLVRGCVFGDLEGRVLYTVASGPRGTAFLSRWVKPDKKFILDARTACSDVPISSMSMSGDAGMFALGSVDGSIILWDTGKWKPMKKFKEVHNLPVTCIAARPYPVPLQGDLEGVQMNSLSASADSQMAWLTLQKSAPRKKKAGESSFIGGLINKMLWELLITILIIILFLYQVALETNEKCSNEWNQKQFGAFRECLFHEVIIAPASRPGILVPPH